MRASKVVALPLLLLFLVACTVPEKPGAGPAGAPGGIENGAVAPHQDPVLIDAFGAPARGGFGYRERGISPAAAYYAAPWSPPGSADLDTRWADDEGEGFPPRSHAAPEPASFWLLGLGLVLLMLRRRRTTRAIRTGELP